MRLFWSPSWGFSSGGCSLCKTASPAKFPGGKTYVTPASSIPQLFHQKPLSDPRLADKQLTKQWLSLLPSVPTMAIGLVAPQWDQGPLLLHETVKWLSTCKMIVMHKHSWPWWCIQPLSLAWQLNLLPFYPHREQKKINGTSEHVGSQDYWSRAGESSWNVSI